MKLHEIIEEPDPIITDPCKMLGPYRETRVHIRYPRRHGHEMVVVDELGNAVRMRQFPDGHLGYVGEDG